MREGTDQSPQDHQSSNSFRTWRIASVATGVVRVVFATGSGFVLENNRTPMRQPFVLEPLFIDAEPTDNDKRCDHHGNTAVIRAEARDDSATDEVTPHRGARTASCVRGLHAFDEVLLVVSEVWKRHQITIMVSRHNGYRPTRVAGRINHLQVAGQSRRWLQCQLIPMHRLEGRIRQLEFQTSPALRPYFTSLRV